MTDKKTTETKTEPTVTVDERKITWGYSKKIQTAPYETAEVSVYMTDNVPFGIEVGDHLAARTESAFNELKVVVWGAHGLDYGFTETGEPQLLVQAPPAPAPVPVPAPAPAQQPATAPPNAPVAGSLIGVYPEVPAFCKDCAGVEFWDNRAQNDTKIGAGQKIGPDFKCKKCEGGNGSGKPLYRPGSYDYNQNVGKAAAAPAPMQPPAAPDAPPTQPPLTPANISNPDNPDEAPF